MEELLNEVRALREEVTGLRRDMRSQAQAAARALEPLPIAATTGELVSVYVPDVPLGARPA